METLVVKVPAAPSGVPARRGRLALLAAWYLAFAVAAVTLIPFGHGG